MPTIWGILERVDYAWMRVTRQLPKTAKRRAPATTTRGADSGHPPTPAASADEGPPSLGNPQRAAQVFGRNSCLWTGRATRLLQDRGVNHDYVDLDDTNNQAFHVQLISETKQETSPYVYVRGEFIGGYDELSELDRLGQLAERVLPEAERKQGPLKSKVVVTPRQSEE